METVKTIGTVDWEWFHELEPVIHWLLAVVNYDLFLEPPTSAGKKQEVIVSPTTNH